MRYQNIFFTFLLITCFFNQKGIICYEYKIDYDIESPKDSNVLLIGKKYFDNKMHLIRAVQLEPEMRDSCWSNWSYDIYGNITKELSSCSDSIITNDLINEYTYISNNKLSSEKSIRTKPFFELSITKYTKTSIVKTVYSDTNKVAAGKFESKDVEIYNSLGKIKNVFKINNKGDTIVLKNFLYFPLADTSKIRNSIRSLDKLYAIVYLNNFNQEEITDYFDSLQYKGSTIKKYNYQQKIILEQYYDKIRNEITSQVIYTYDKLGNLLKTKNENFIDKLTKINTYNKGKVIREDYIYDTFLDHSIIYNYKTMN